MAAPRDPLGADVVAQMAEAIRGLDNGTVEQLVRLACTNDRVDFDRFVRAHRLAPERMARLWGAVRTVVR